MEVNPFAQAAPPRSLRSSVSSNPFEEEEPSAAPAPSIVSTNPFEDEAEPHVEAVPGSPDEADMPKWLQSAASQISLGPSASEPPASARELFPPVATLEPLMAPAPANNPFATASPLASSAPAPADAVAPIEVEPASFAADMGRGCLALLSGGRHADVSFELPARSLRAHMTILEARCGQSLVDSLAAGAVGPATLADGLLKITLPTAAVGDPSGASLAALLRYVYTESFEPELLAGKGGTLALLRLTTRFESAGSSPALERLRHLCERELAAAATTETLVGVAHEAAALGAEQLVRFCLQSMRAQFDMLHARGDVSTLQVALCAELFSLRSPAILQDALAHGRADVADFVIETAGGDVATRALLATLDSKGRTALEVALLHDELDAATNLLAKGAPVDAMSGGGDEPLLHTICYAAAGKPADSDRAVRKLKLMLEHGASVDAMNGRGESTLDVAYFRGGEAVVQLLLQYKATSSMTMADGGCLLHAAALHRRADVLEAALASLSVIGVDLNQQDAAGRTPLHVAVESGLPDLVSPLLRVKASTEVQADDGATPLRRAVSQGDLPITQMLLAQGADRNSLGADAVPLIVVATETSVPVALALVRAGADLNQPDPSGRTALEVAVAKGEHELCELLLTKGAKPTARKDEMGNTSLHVAVTVKSEHLVRLLVRHKAELSEQNRRGQTPLILSAESGQTSVVELLLHSGAPLHLCDTSNRSALELALQNGHLDCLKILLQQSIVDVNGITRRGSSLLHLAAEIGDEARITFLLSMQAQVDVLNPNGETPLHWACSLGHLAAVRALVQYGANAMLHERVQGLTPLHAACGSRGQPAVLALLIQRCEAMGWNNQPQRCNLLDGNRNTPLHTSTKLAPHPVKYVPILLEHGANPNLTNAQGQNVLHLLAERAVRQQQERQAVNGQQETGEAGDGGAGVTGAGANGGANGVAAAAGTPELPASRLLELLSEHNLQLDAQESESLNTALHHAAFGGCIELAVQLVQMGAAVGLPNRDGFTPLDSSYRDPSNPSKSLQSLLISKIAKPLPWTPDRMVSACQSCKLPFNKADPKMVRKHHCRHCGRCVCGTCSPHRMAIPKFGSTQDERVCLLCERVLLEEKSADSPWAAAQAAQPPAAAPPQI